MLSSTGQWCPLSMGKRVTYQYDRRSLYHDVIIMPCPMSLSLSGQCSLCGGSAMHHSQHGFLRSSSDSWWEFSGFLALCMIVQAAGLIPRLPSCCSYCKCWKAGKGNILQSACSREVFTWQYVLPVEGSADELANWGIMMDSKWQNQQIKTFS